MAGKNIVLKENQILFKEGDPSNGMYVVRRGELLVYLEKAGHEVKLAHISAGGMIGEMAFFDKQPRSASVKATEETEVTLITEEDFSKLMRQIPKWFCSIMSSLSTRLRDTNNRLQKLENQRAGAKTPYEDLTRILHVLHLLWHKEGVKEGKNWCLDRKIAEKEIVDMFNCEPKNITDLFNTLIKQRFFSISTDNYKNELLTLSNKGELSFLAHFIHDYVKNNNTLSLPEPALNMLDALEQLVKDSAYDSVSISFEDILVQGERMSADTSQWKSLLTCFKKPNDTLALVKISNGVGFKVNKKALPQYIKYHKLLYALAQAGLARAL